MADSKRLLAPKVRAIEKELRDGRKRPTTADVFTWLLDVAKGRHINFVLAQMSISEASIHSTSEMLTRMIIQCCKTPELVNDLREEIARVLEEEGGWSKAAPYKMKLVDSFMREISRHQPMGIGTLLSSTLLLLQHHGYLINHILNSRNVTRRKARCKTIQWCGVTCWRACNGGR